MNMKKETGSSAVLYNALIKTLTFCLFLYFILIAVIIVKHPSTQKEIQANFYGVKVATDGKGAQPNQQKPYICLDLDGTLNYAHECSRIEWVATVLKRFIFYSLVTLFLLFFIKLKYILITLLTILISFCFAYLFEKTKYRRKNI